jgi:HPt (histidine-containing phosphotransfer) domain-containing protein
MDRPRLLDVDATVQRLGDATLLPIIARVFTETGPSLLDSIAQSLRDNDLAKVGLDAHSLKGAVATFEAPLVLSSVAALEQHAKKNNAGATNVAFETARPLVERLLIELAQ